MANYLCIYPVADKQIDEFILHPKSIREYIEGRDLMPIGPEMNHRNVDLHHLILNGTTDFVAGSGTIFQTWLTVGNHSAIDLTGDNEHFAFKSNQILALLELLSRIDQATVKSRFIQWLRNSGDRYQPTDEECAEMAAGYENFTRSVREAVKDKLGLIWVSC